MDNYLALARKWRPRNFTQLIGQEHITKIIINSLEHQQLHHAYLFTGTRGVGKTSIARILAKALNCEQGVSSNPCLQCAVCKAIEDSCFIDLLEIDAASKTRIEDTRELLENVQYLPAHGRYKIFLIDEVHMLSQHSFNALLKTLEEPPSHVKFLLATTEAQKLPATILSRCLQFHLKHIALEVIMQQLKYILDTEKYLFELPALELLAKAARGSMRDALSLLEQALADADHGKLSVAGVKAILGYTQKDYILQIVQALIKPDAHQLISISRQIASEGGQFGYVLAELLSVLHQIVIIQALPNNDPLLSADLAIQDLAAALTPEDTQLFYQIGIKGITEMELAPTLAIGFEMTILRMLAFRPAPAASTPLLAYNNGITINKEQEETFRPPLIATSTAMEKSPNQTNANCAELAINTKKYAAAQSPIIKKQEIKQITANNWATIRKELKLSGPTLNAACNTKFIEKSAHNIILRAAISHQTLFSTYVKNTLEQALTSYYNEPINVSFDFMNLRDSASEQLQVVEHTLKSDPVFLQLQQEFGAELTKNSLVLERTSAISPSSSVTEMEDL